MEIKTSIVPVCLIMFTTAPIISTKKTSAAASFNPLGMAVNNPKTLVGVAKPLASSPKRTPCTEIFFGISL